MGWGVDTTGVADTVTFSSNEYFQDPMWSPISPYQYPWTAPWYPWAVPTHTFTWPPPLPAKGWECPKCASVYGPHVDECKCCNGGR